MTNPDGRLDTVSNLNNILAAAMSGGGPSMFMGQKRKRTTQGRKKIEIKKIDNVSNRQVTFSKRRAGLFKKASEICILTGAEATIIVQSSGKRFYSFGHPTVDGVINRYLSKDENNNAAATATAAANTISPAEMREFNAEYDRLSKELEAEKKKMEAQEKAAAMNNSNGTNFWWEEEIGNMNLEQLEQHEAALEELRKNVLTKADELALVRNSHHHQQHHHAMMNNVDLNRTVIGAASAFGSYDNFNNHANQFDLHRSPSSSAIVPYASDNSFYGNNNNQV